jgi:hypothetical protein
VRARLSGGDPSSALCKTIRSDLSDPKDIVPLSVLIMKHRIAGLASLPRVSTCPHRLYAPPLARRIYGVTQHSAAIARPLQFRSFTIAARLKAEAPKFEKYDNSNARPASELNDNITQEEKDHFAKRLAEDKGKQIRTPWHREGSDVPPVARERSAGAMTKGPSHHPHIL